MSKEYKPDLESERRKWEFRYNNQDKRLKDMETTIRDLRKTIRELRRRIKENEDE